MLSIYKENTAPMEARPGDAQAGTRDELAHQIAHLQAKNAELEQRYNNLESKLVDVLAATTAHEEMIQALRAQNESLKAAVDAWPRPDGGEWDESGDDDDGSAHVEGSAGNASADGSERVPQHDNHDAQDVRRPHAAGVDRGTVERGMQPHAESCEAESLLDGEDYDMEGSDGCIVDDLADLDQDAEAFQALLAARMPISSYSNPLAGFSKEDRTEVIAIFTACMLEALPQLQAQWCLAADGLRESIHDLETPTAMRQVRMTASRMRLNLDMRNLEREGNTGARWQETVKSVISTVVAVDEMQNAGPHSRPGSKAAPRLAALKAIPDLKGKAQKALMSTDYAADLCVCLLRHRIAHRGDPPSLDDLWAEASDLFGTLPGVNCAEIRSGQVQQAQPVLTDDEGAASDAEASNNDSASEGVKQVLLHRARQAQAQVLAAHAAQACPAADITAGAGAGGSIVVGTAQTGTAAAADAAPGAPAGAAAAQRGEPLCVAGVQQEGSSMADDTRAAGGAADACAAEKSEAPAPGGDAAADLMDAQTVLGGGGTALGEPGTGTVAAQPHKQAGAGADHGSIACESGLAPAGVDAAAGGSAPVAAVHEQVGDAGSDADSGTSADGCGDDTETTAEEGGDAEVAHVLQDDDDAGDAEFTDGPAPTALQTADVVDDAGSGGAAVDLVEDASSGHAAAAPSGDGSGGCAREDAEAGLGSGPLPDLGSVEAAAEQAPGDRATVCAPGVGAADGKDHVCTHFPARADQAVPCEPASEPACARAAPPGPAAADPPALAAGVDAASGAGGGEATQGGGGALAGFPNAPAEHFSPNDRDHQAGSSLSPAPLQSGIAPGASLEGACVGGDVLPPRDGVADGEGAGLTLPPEGLPAQGAPAPAAEAAEDGGPGEDCVARYWAAAQPQPQAVPPQWLVDGVHMLAHLPVVDALNLCVEIQSLLSFLHPSLSFLTPGAADSSFANGTLGVFMVPAPADGQSQGLFDADDRGDGGSVYVMLQDSRPLRSLALVLRAAECALRRLLNSVQQSAHLQEASPDVLAMLTRCLGNICSNFPRLSPVLQLCDIYRGTSRMFQSTNLLLGRDLSSRVRNLQLRHLLEPLFSPSPERPHIQQASVGNFYAARSSGCTTQAAGTKIKQLLHHACVWQANMRAASLETPDENGDEGRQPPFIRPQLLAPMLEETIPRTAHEGAHPRFADLLQISDSAALDSPLERLRMRAVPTQRTRAPRSDLCKHLCKLAGLQARPAAAAVMLRRAARNPVVHLCDDVASAGGLLPVAAMKKVMGLQLVETEPEHRSRRPVEDPAAAEAVEPMVRNAHICVWPSVTRGERHRLYRTYSDGADFIPGLEARFEDLEYRTCAEQLPVTTGAQVRDASHRLEAAALQYRQEMGWPPGRTPVHQSPAAGGAAPAGGAATSPVAHCTLATPEQQVDGAASAVPQHPQAAAEAAAPAPDEAGSSRASSPDSSADVVPRKRRRGSENDLDYLDSSEEDVLGARAAAAPVQSHVAKKHRGSTSEAMRPPHRAANRLAGPGRGKSHAAQVKVKEDLRVQAVLGRSLDPVPLFDDSRQAMVPRRVKERLKPWQVEGLKHLFETIILDHDSDLWRAHRREVAAARQALGTGASPDVEDAPCHAGGAILAQTMGSGKTLQSIILALLFMVVRAKQHEHARVVIVVPTNVQLNWMDELELWLREFTTSGVTRTEGQLTLETPDLRLSAWVLEGWSRLEPVQRWFEHGAAPSAKAVKASIKREKMLRSKLKVPIASTTHPHGSILLVTHGAFWRLWRAGQADGGEGAAKAEVVQHVVEGAGLVIMDEAHCIRNANTYLAKSMAAFRTPRRVALSGYPLMNSVDEYYHMLAWACPDFFPDKAHFDLVYKEPIEAGRRLGASERVRKRMARQSQILQDLVRPILHRVGPEELGRSLPPKLEAVIAVRMPPRMVALYEAAVARMSDAKVTFLAMVPLVHHLLFNPEMFLADLKDMAAGKPPPEDYIRPDTSGFGEPDPADPARPRDAGTSAPKKQPLAPAAAQRIVDDFDGILNGHELTFLDSPKATLVVQLVQDTVTHDRKVLVFVSYLEDMKTLVKHCEQKVRTRGGAAPLVLNMSGSTPPAERLVHVRAFNTYHGPAVFVLTTRACGVGINLTAATRAIIAFPNYNPSHEGQAAARIHRLGQRQRVEIFRIVCDGAYDHKVMKRAMEKEAMAMAVVDGQAVKAIMGEADRHNFELQPSEGTCQLAAAATTDEDRASLEAVVAIARSAGCDIATIQLWKQLLAEDKDMKINSNSRRKLRLRLLARQGRNAEGQEGPGLTAWQLRNLRQSQRREQGTAAAATYRPDGGSDSGVELSSDDDFDADLPVPRRRPHSPKPPASVPVRPTTTLAAPPLARAASSPAAARAPASSAPPSARNCPIQAQPPPVAGPCGLVSPGSIVPMPPKRSASAPKAHQEAAAPAAASSRGDLPTVQVASTAPPVRVHPPALSAASLLAGAVQPATPAAATLAGPQGAGPPGAAPAAPLAPHDAVDSTTKKRARTALPAAVEKLRGASSAAQRSSGAQRAGPAKGVMSREEWERGCGRVPVAAVAPRRSTASPRVGSPSGGGLSVRGAARVSAVAGRAAQAATRDSSSPRYKAPCVESPLQGRARRSQPATQPQAGSQEHETAQAAPAGSDSTGAPPEAPSQLSPCELYSSGAQAATPPASHSRDRTNAPSRSRQERTRTLLDLGCKLMPGTRAAGSPAAMAAAASAGRPSAASSVPAAPQRASRAAAAAAHQPVAKQEAGSSGPPTGRADDAGATTAVDGLQRGSCDTGGDSHHDSPQVVRDCPGRPRERHLGAMKASPRSRRGALPQRRLRASGARAPVPAPAAPGSGYWHDGAVIVIDDDDDE